MEGFPELANGDGKLAVTEYIRNTSPKSWTGRASFRAIDEETGLTVLTSSDNPSLTVQSGTTHTSRFEAILPKAKLWHFDRPNLYRLISSIGSGQETHRLTATFGVRKLEVKGSGFFFNVQPVRLMHVAPMARRNPEF